MRRKDSITWRLVNVISNCNKESAISEYELVAEWLVASKMEPIAFSQPFYGYSKLHFNKMLASVRSRMRGVLDLQPNQIKFYKKDGNKYYYKDLL